MWSSICLASATGTAEGARKLPKAVPAGPQLLLGLNGPSSCGNHFSYLSGIGFNLKSLCIVTVPLYRH